MLRSEGEGLMVGLWDFLPDDSGGNIVSFLYIFAKADIDSLHPV